MASVSSTATNRSHRHSFKVLLCEKLSKRLIKLRNVMRMSRTKRDKFGVINFSLNALSRLLALWKDLQTDEPFLLLFPCLAQRDRWFIASSQPFSF